MCPRHTCRRYAYFCLVLVAFLLDWDCHTCSRIWSTMFFFFFFFFLHFKLHFCLFRVCAGDGAACPCSEGCGEAGAADTTSPCIALEQLQRGQSIDDQYHRTSAIICVYFTYKGSAIQIRYMCPRSSTSMKSLMCRFRSTGLDWMQRRRFPVCQLHRSNGNDFKASSSPCEAAEAH